VFFCVLSTHLISQRYYKKKAKPPPKPREFIPEVEWRKHKKEEAGSCLADDNCSFSDV
jgi:hypothetical protein